MGVSTDKKQTHCSVASILKCKVHIHQSLQNHRQFNDTSYTKISCLKIGTRWPLIFENLLHVMLECYIKLRAKESERSDRCSSRCSSGSQFSHFYFAGPLQRKEPVMKGKSG